MDSVLQKVNEILLQLPVTASALEFRDVLKQLEEAAEQERLISTAAASTATNAAMESAVKQVTEANLKANSARLKEADSAVQAAATN